MKPLNIAILGQGRSGRDIHGAYLRTVPDRFKIATVVEPLPERALRARAEYGCEVLDDYRALFGRADLDLVVNATPSHLHVPISLDLLNHGFNVLCEKPLAHRVSEVDALVDAATRAGRTLAIFQQSRFAPYFSKVREVIDSGVLGRIVQISIAFNGFGRRWDWQTLQEYNGGNLLNTGPHPLDQALQLFGSDIPQVTCVMDRANTFGDAEDYVKLILRGAGRPLIDLEISSCCPYPSFTYNVQGTQGGLKGTTSHVEWKYFVPAEAPTQHLIREPLCQPDGTPAYCGETLQWHECAWDDSQPAEMVMRMTGFYYDMLARALTLGEPLEVTPEHVRVQMAVIEECQRQNPHIYRNQP
jgi:scyllo-inositol 2-dehydrogenase (NADP+)